MKKLIGIALIASTLYSCGGIDNQKSANQNNATLQTELAQAKQENEILKLQHELEMLKAKQETVDPARLAALENSIARYAYFGNALPSDARHTQPVDNEWTDHETQNTSSTDAYKTGKTTPTVETKPANEVKKKKGMSTPVKGALIGAGVGAATGAVVAKNHRVKGAVIGAVVGAGAGAGTGVIIDKRKEKKIESTPYFASNTFLK